MDNFPSLPDALARLLTRYELEEKRSLSDVAIRVKLHLKPYFGDRPINEIKTLDIEAYAASRKREGAKNATINRDLEVLRQALRMYEEECGLRMPRIKRLEERNARESYFEPAEFAKVLGRLPRPLRPPFQFAYLTGWRMRSEVLTLRWDRNVRWEAGIVELNASQTKGKRSRAFPFRVLPDLERLLLTRRAETPQDCPWVFWRYNGLPISNCYQAWRTACRRAGLAGRVPHDLRRSAAKNLVRAGVPEKLVMELVGWSTPAMLHRYHIVRESDLADAVKKLAAHLG